MAVKKNMPRRQTVHAQAYVDGNTVRKARPDRDARTAHGSRVQGNTVRKTGTKQSPKTGARKEKRLKSHTIRRNQERALNMDLPYVMALTAAVICALWICVSYLHVQSTITARLHSIQEKERKLEVLKSENDALQTSIEAYVDLNHVFEVATQELGMVYPGKDQILLFKRTESEYVRQNEDIPKH